jgi:hypothetical protein
MVTGDGTDLDTNERDGDGLLLDALAETRLTPDEDGIRELIDHVRHRGDGGLVIAVLGGLTVAEADQLAALRTAGTTCVALLLHPMTWLNLPEEDRVRFDAEHDAIALRLLRAGWRVLPVAHGSRLATLWPTAAARGSQGFAVRAAMAETVAPAGTQSGPVTS